MRLESYLLGVEGVVRLAQIVSDTFVSESWLQPSASKLGLYYVLWPWRPWWSCAARARHDERAGHPPKNASATVTQSEADTDRRCRAEQARRLPPRCEAAGQLLLQEDAKRCRGKPRGKLRQQDFSGSETAQIATYPRRRGVAAVAARGGESQACCKVRRG